MYSFAGGATGAANALAEFRGPLGLEYGPRNFLRGPGAFNLDAGLGKNFPIIESKLNLQFRADAFNVLNHPAFGTGSVNIVNSASAFGQITAHLQLGARCTVLPADGVLAPLRANRTIKSPGQVPGLLHQRLKLFAGRGNYGFMKSSARIR